MRNLTAKIRSRAASTRLSGALRRSSTLLGAALLASAGACGQPVSPKCFGPRSNITVAWPA